MREVSKTITDRLAERRMTRHSKRSGLRSFTEEGTKEVERTRLA